MSHLPGFGHSKSYGHALGQRFWAPVSVQILQFPVFWLPSHFVPLFVPSRNRDESTITEGYVYITRKQMYLHAAGSEAHTQSCNVSVSTLNSVLLRIIFGNCLARCTGDTHKHCLQSVVPPSFLSPRINFVVYIISRRSACHANV